MLRPPHTRTASFSAAILAALLAPGAALAEDETWLVTAEAPAAMPVSEPQTDWYGGGALPGASIYRSLSPAFLLGGKLRAGVLADGGTESDDIMQKGAGGLGSLTLAARVRPLPGSSYRRGTGLWLEVAAGGALTGRDLRPTAELGIGWGFAAGRVGIGPSLRYLHVYQPDRGHVSGDDASIALAGVELSFFDRARPADAMPLVAEIEAPVAPVEPSDRDGDGIMDPDDGCPDDPEDRDGFQDEDGCPDGDNDGDKIADLVDRCPNEAEVVNGVDDQDGCPDQGLFVVVEDRITLDEKVLFDTGRARVRRNGREVLSAIVAYIVAHPEFQQVTLEGHADERGSEEFNLKLSRSRAKRVKRALTELGLEIEIDVAGFGESRPSADGHGEGAWKMNRRVEFVLLRKRKVPASETGAGVVGTPPATVPSGDKATEKPATAPTGVK